MCKEYFDVLAKKRFNSEEKSEGDSRKKSKSVLEKKYEEKKAKGSFNIMIILLSGDVHY